MLGPTVAAQGFQGMADRVAEIEDTPAIAFPFVCRDHRGLDGAGGPDDPVKRGRFQLQDLVHVLFQKREEFGVRDHPVFDDFRQACPVFTRGERPEGAGIDEDQLGLIEGPD